MDKYLVPLSKASAKNEHSVTSNDAQAPHKRPSSTLDEEAENAPKKLKPMQSQVDTSNKKPTMVVVGDLGRNESRLVESQPQKTSPIPARRAIPGSHVSPSTNEIAAQPNWDHSWDDLFQSEMKKSYWDTLQQFVAARRKQNRVHPAADEVYTAFKLTPLNKVRVVLLGQDPYHGRGQAHGLAFSVKRGIPLPPSLMNIFKEISVDVGGQTEHHNRTWQPKHGNLEHWALQGVFLLNTVLTVDEGQANSHAGRGWEHFTTAVIKYIATHCKNVVFLLWGKSAQTKKVLIPKDHNHLVLESHHPSPLSASRGFFGCKHFSKTNDFLSKTGSPPIIWRVEDYENSTASIITA